jgi:hypothetical protein
VLARSLGAVSPDKGSSTRSAFEICTLFDIDRGTGKGEIQVKCADADSTRQCADAVLQIIQGGDSTTVVYATTSIKCDDTIYTVSTGSNTGQL